MKKKFSLKKELRDWGIFASIIAILYFTGLHTDVAAFAQRMVLTTGFITADTETELSDQTIDYSFKVQTLNGDIVTLEKFKGKVIFLNEWATWCAPCIAEMPGIQSLYDNIGDHKNIEFVMLSLDHDMKKVNKFVSKKGYTFPIYTPASEVPIEFQSSSIPTTFVISPEGKIISKKVGMAKYDTKKFVEFMLKQANY